MGKSSTVIIIREMKSLLIAIHVCTDTQVNFYTKKKIKNKQ